jgi:hypothetical protein
MADNHLFAGERKANYFDFFLKIMKNLQIVAVNLPWALAQKLTYNVPYIYTYIYIYNAKTLRHLFSVNKNYENRFHINNYFV